MAIEILDGGACKAAGLIETAVGPAGTVEAKGIRAYEVESTSSILVTLEDPIGESELLVNAQRSGAAGLARVTRVNDEQIRFETLTAGGLAAQGQIWFMVFRIPRGEVAPAP